MRVLLTGHQGYIGAILAPMLFAAGHDVVGLDSGLFEGSNFGPAPRPIPEMRKDLRDANAADLDGFEAVIHLAGLSNDPLGNLNPDLTYAINHQASVRLAELARAAGVSRFLFSSSCSIYGAAGDDLLDEQAVFNPVTPYGRSKELVERDVSRLAGDDFSPTFLRNATAYGVSSRLRFDLVLNNMVAWAVTTGQVYIKSDGTPWRPLVHIEDISRAFLAALHAPRQAIHNQAFNVGQTWENYRVSELAEIVAAAVPGARIVYAPGGGPDQRNYRVSCEKIRRLLPEFQPAWDATRGAQELFQAYTRVGVTLEEFEGPRYKRIAHIQQLVGSGRLGEDLRWRRPQPEASGG